MAKNVLNEQQEKFCQFYMETQNATKSAILAGYSESSASVQGSRLMNNAKIKKRLAELRAEEGLEYTAEKDMAVEVLIKMIENPKTEPQHRLTAIDKLARIQGWFKETSTIEVNHNNIDKLSDDELEKRMKELTGDVINLNDYKKDA